MIATRPFYPKIWQLKACASRRSNSVARRKRYSVHHCWQGLRAHHFIAARDRIEGSARNQREEARTSRQRGVSQVSKAVQAVSITPHMLIECTGTSRVALPLKALLPSSKSLVTSKRSSLSLADHCCLLCWCRVVDF